MGPLLFSWVACGVSLTALVQVILTYYHVSCQLSILIFFAFYYVISSALQFHGKVHGWYSINERKICRRTPQPSKPIFCIGLNLN